jgi:hypothetical protein
MNDDLALYIGAESFDYRVEKVARIAEGELTKYSKWYKDRISMHAVFN